MSGIHESDLMHRLIANIARERAAARTVVKSLAMATPRKDALARAAVFALNARVALPYRAAGAERPREAAHA